MIIFIAVCIALATGMIIGLLVLPDLHMFTLLVPLSAALICCLIEDHRRKLDANQE